MRSLFAAGLRTTRSRMVGITSTTGLPKLVALVSVMATISAAPSSAGFNYDFWIGEDFRATIYSAGTHGHPEISDENDANSLKPKLHTVVAIFNELRRCWVPPRSSDAEPGMEITVRFSFKRNGDILAQPRTTYTKAGASSGTRAMYFNAITAALNRCTPMNFSKGLAATIPGHPFAIRFVDNRTDCTKIQCHLAPPADAR
jgi:hypothetical protein